MGNGTVTYSQLGNMGRLGNMLFQICAAIAYALEYGKSFVFPEWKYSHYMQKELPSGNINIDHTFNESSFTYSPIHFLDGNVNVNGFFQSNLYFEKHISEILPYITLNDFYKEYIIGKYGYYFTKKTCSIHVRHGDYLTNPETNAYHGILTKEYYEKAIHQLYGDNTKDVLFLIMSDNLEWCYNNFKHPNQLFIEGEEDIIDLFIGSYCGNNIIANSSFSWWQAYLNKNTTKKVIAPKNWFTGKNAPQITKDIYCEDWIII